MNHPVKPDFIPSLIGITLGLVLFGALAAVAQTPDPNKHLFLLAGQSNMAGRGAIDPQNNTAHPWVSVLAKDGTWKPAVDPLHYDKPEAAVGPGKTFGETIANQNPGITIGLIPAACGGSPISVWAPGVYFSQTNSYPYDDALARARRAMQDGTLKAILWHQGESDRTAALAAVYETKLTELINRFRSDLEMPNLPFYIGELGQFGGWNSDYAAITQAHRNVAQTMTNVYFIPSSGLTSNSDNLHFDRPSAQTLGARYAAAYQAPSVQINRTWIPVNAGIYNWDNASSQNNWWFSGFPNALGTTADLSINLAGAQTINLNQTITLGTLKLSDPINASNGANWSATTIAANAGSLVMDTASGNALISKPTVLNRTEDKIVSNIQLNDHLTLNCSQTDVRGWLTIQGVISGSGKSVEKTGPGLVRLAGAQTYDGGTTISAGTLQLGSGVTGGNGSLVGNITNNAALSFNNADAQGFSTANYSGTGNFAKSGSGTLSLTGSCSLGGGAGSAFQVGSSGATSATTVDATTASSFTFSGAKFYVGAGPAGGGSMLGTLKLGILSSITANQVSIAGLDPDSNSDNGHAGLVTTLANSTTTISTANMTIGTAKASGSISGEMGGVFTLGVGATLNLGTSNARTNLVLARNTSTTTAGAGTMNLAGVVTGTAGTAIANFYLNKLTLAYTTAGATLTGSMTLSDSTSNNLNVSGESGTGGVVQIGYNETSGTTTGTLTIGNLGSSSAIASSDNGTAILIAKKGSGTSTGTLTIKAGTLKITTTGAAIAGGGGNSTLNLSGGARLVAGASSTNWIHSLTTAALGAGGAIIDTAGFNLGIAQPFSGNGGLAKDAAGTLTLTGVSTYTGETNITGGTLVIDAANALTTGNLAVSNNARLGGNGSTPAAVTVQTGGRLLANISDWNGAAGIGFADLQVGSLTFNGAWTLDVASLTSYANFNGTSKTFPILTSTGGITGFNAGSVAIVANAFTGTGTWSVQKSNNTLDLVYTAASAYQIWDNQFTADLSDPNADHDTDGMSNFEEFAFGLDPTSGASSNPITEPLNSTTRQFRYTRRAASGLGYTIWTSTTLQADVWTLSIGAQQQASPEVINGTETVLVTLGALPVSDLLFVRVKAE